MLRPYKTADYPQIKQMLKSYYKSVHSRFKEDFLKKELLRLCSTDVLMVYEQNKSVIGIMWIYCRDRKGRIKYLIVKRQHHGKGYGTKMMKWAMQWFRKMRLEKADLKVDVGNKAAIGLYEKSGFKARSVVMEKEIA